MSCHFWGRVAKNFANLSLKFTAACQSVTEDPGPVKSQKGARCQKWFGNFFTPASLTPSGSCHKYRSIGGCRKIKNCIHQHVKRRKGVDKNAKETVDASRNTLPSLSPSLFLSLPFLPLHSHFPNMDQVTRGLLLFALCQ